MASNPLLLIVVGASCCALSCLSLWLAIPPLIGVPLWLTAGSAAVALIRGGWSHLPGIMIGTMLAIVCWPQVTSDHSLIAWTIAIHQYHLWNLVAVTCIYSIAAKVIYQLGLQLRFSDGIMFWGALIGSALPVWLYLEAGNGLDWSHSDNLEGLSSHVYLLLAVCVGAFALWWPTWVLFDRSAQTRRMWYKVNIPITILLLTLFVTFMELRDDRFAEQQQLLQNEGQRINDQVSLVMQRSINDLVALRGFYQASEQVSWSEYNRFIEALGIYDETIQALAWMPRLSHADRNDFVKLIHDELGVPFAIRELDHQRKVVTAGNRDEYLPIAYTYPLADNIDVLGIDVWSNPPAAAAIAESLQSGEVTFITPFPLVQNPDIIAMIGFLAIPADDKSLSSVLEVVIRLDDLFSLGVSLLNNFSGSITVSDSEGRSIYQQGDPTHDGEEYYQYRGPLNVKNLSWDVVYRPSLEVIRSRLDLVSYVVLLGGALAAGFLGLHLFIMVSRNQLIEQAVQVATEEARLATQLADQANQAKSRFLAVMSHEMRTPLNGVIGAMDLLERGGLNAEQSDLVNIAQQSGKSLLHLINEILDLSKIEAGSVELEVQSHDVVQLCGDTMRMMSVKMSEKELDGWLTCPPALPAWQGDGHRLRQIMLNLISNAVKFTHRGYVAVDVQRRNSHLVIEVRDSGIGIQAGTTEKIFAPFMQSDASMTRKYAGTGLGLAVSRGLAEVMGGSISVTSEQGIGSVFTLVLPWPHASQEYKLPKIPPYRLLGDDRLFRRSVEVMLGQPPSDEGIAIVHVDEEHLGTPIANAIAIARHPKVANGFGQVLGKPVSPGDLIAALHGIDRPSSGKNKAISSVDHGMILKVLLVEDHPVNQRVALAMLKRLQCEVVLANNGLEALALFGHYDCVLMDCQMPDLDGYEATRRWRQLELEAGMPEVRIVAMTANTMKEDREACYEAGMNDFLAKPVTLARLQVALTNRVDSSDFAVN